MNELLHRLTSRTLWLAIFTVGTLLLNEQWTEAASVAISYILGEKAIDGVSKTRSIKVDNAHVKELNVSQTTPDEVDKSSIVTGAFRQRTFDEKTDE